MAFVFATGTTFMNANTSNEEVMQIDCIAMAWAANEIEELTYEQFQAVVAACEASQELPT